MGILSKLFGRSQTPVSRDGAAHYVDKDNLGTRIKDWDHYQGMIVADMQKSPDLPGVAVFTFANAETAQQALRQISCIKTANDTGNLISIATIDFGVVDSGGEWAAIVHGKGLTRELQEESAKVFGEYGGTERANRAPAATTRAPRGAKAEKGSVTLSHKQDLSEQGGMGSKDIYTATTKQAAIEFLKRKNIGRPYYYIEIETPDGWVGKDKDGMYEF